jgi:indole-3-glycerol phosphate synthase
VNRKASDSGILPLILQRKQLEVGELERAAPAWRTAAEQAPAPPGFAAALRAGPSVGVIGEVKRRSPSAGALGGGDLPARAAAYAAGGAVAISVLTDGPFFGGSLADLEAVRAGVGVPVLRKDFVLAPVQVWQARAAGAAAVLLIARILDDALLEDLRSLAAETGMAALVEVHDQAELERAIAAGAGIVGVNNRDLDSLRVDLDTTARLARSVPAGCLLVGESGVRAVADVIRLADAGVDAVLVGEALMRSDDPAAETRRFASVPRRLRS